MVPNGTCGKLKLYLKRANASAKQGKKQQQRLSRSLRRRGYVDQFERLPITYSVCATEQT
jgi:hypothetical protein